MVTMRKALTYLVLRAFIRGRSAVCKWPLHSMGNKRWGQCSQGDQNVQPTIQGLLLADLAGMGWQLSQVMEHGSPNCENTKSPCAP